MANYIDADEVYEVLNGLLNDIEDSVETTFDFDAGWETALRAANCKITDIPAAEVRPERHGHWVAKELGNEYYTYTGYFCSECGRKLIGYSFPSDAPYCHCGAKMDGEDGESND